MTLRFEGDMVGVLVVRGMRVVFVDFLAVVEGFEDGG
jgi:hypothetical protein